VRIVTVLGTRPEIIRLSRVIPLLDAHAEHVLVHTGQNFDARLSGIFFDELALRPPDVHLGVQACSFGEQAGRIIALTDRVFQERRPDRVLILGDTNSGLSALPARRRGIPVYHMEAGNRCYDDRVPEEVNRRIIDHSSSVLLPYTERSRANLLREGIASQRIFVTGNPIRQVIEGVQDRIAASGALDRLGLDEKRYLVVTMHRAENVDVEVRLRNLVAALDIVAATFDMPVVCSVHPRTRSRMEAYGISRTHQNVRFMEPLGFIDFVRLEQSAFCVLSDSGTVQEEACILGVPHVTIRDVTERPETVECGSNLLSGNDPADIVQAVRIVTASPPAWIPPPEYLAPAVAETVCRIVTGFRLPDAADGRDPQ
jgi:UDP-N-acetylglucosamine 2-epimerase (non-hydrolysing)